MIIPSHCKTCGKPIGHLWFRYLSKVREFQKQRDEAQAEAEAGQEIEAETDSRTPEARALDELLIHRYCCRLMFICQPQGLVNMIRNRVEN